MRYILDKEADHRTWVAELKEEEIDGESRVDTLELPVAATSATVLEMDYSGKGFWTLMKALKDAKLKIKAKPNADLGILRQHIQMSMTELSMDDVAVYKFIFNTDVIPRKDFGNTFQERKSKGASKDITLKAPVHVCKFATAVQSKLGASNREAAVPLKTKSGMIKHNA